MTVAGVAALATTALLGLSAGAVLGGGFFASLQWNTRPAALNRPVRLAAVQLLRLLGLAGVLAALAHGGAVLLLAAAAGLLLARGWVLARTDADADEAKEGAWTRR